MDMGFDVNAAASEVSAVSGDMYSRLTIIVILAVVGFLGRMIFVAFGSNVKVDNPLKGLSGVSMIIFGLCLAFGALIMVGKGDKAVRLVQRNIIDPYVISVLEQDACNPATGAYCVIVFEEGREISMNWFDKGINLFEIAHPRQGAVPSSQRPRVRAERAVPPAETDQTPAPA